MTRLPLPAVGTVVGLGRVSGGPTWKTRVEWVVGSSLGVVAPRRSAADPLTMAHGEPLEVIWSNERGLLHAVGTLCAVEHDVVELWVVDVARVERSQRRDAFRLPLRVPLTLRVDDRASVGQTADLSETGVRCHVPRGGCPEVLDAVEVELAIAGQPPLMIPGRVVRRRELVRSPTRIAEEGARAQRVELGIAFAGSDRTVTDRLRRYVFDEQLRRRSTT